MKNSLPLAIVMMCHLFACDVSAKFAPVALKKPLHKKIDG